MTAVSSKASPATGPRPRESSARELRIGDGALAAVLALGAVAAWALTRTYPNYDAYFHLVWGREVVHGIKPSFAAYAAPTEHPLFVALAAVAAVFGRAGDRLLVLVTALSLAGLAVALVRLGRLVLGRWSGVVAAVFVLTSSSVLLYAAKAYVDLPFLAAAAWAAALEAERPRRGAPVMALLVAAGLLRPEAWLLILAYLVWCWPSASRGARPLWKSRLLLVALAAVAPVGWAVLDLVVTGDALHSLHATGKLAEDLSRGRDPSALPGALVSFLVTTLRAPVAALGVAGLALALRRRGWRPLAIPLALIAAGTVTFVVTGLAGFSVLPRYLTLPAVGLTLFAGYAITGWSELDRTDPWRERWRWTAVAAVALGLVGAGVLLPGAARKLDREVRFVRATHEELRSLLHRPAVEAGRACGPVVFPTYRLVPDARWLLDARRGTVTARAATESRTGVRVYVTGSDRAVRRLGRAAGVDPSTNEPDERFREVARSGPLEAWVRCP
ncbi:MAG: hypothetical protein JWN32_3934 [Solirubrobacterales bacterium]|nr:hypothetical protein [Solirubrobacterales bacterium]